VRIAGVDESLRLNGREVDAFIVHQIGPVSALVRRCHSDGGSMVKRGTGQLREKKVCPMACGEAYGLSHAGAGIEDRQPITGRAKRPTQGRRRVSETA